MPPSISSKRRDIVDATKDLLWTMGYESMSPRDILNASNAGQGSLYHHFEGKKAVTLEALTEVGAEMLADLERLFDPRLMPLERIRRYLTVDRRGLSGCRLGRLANESAFSEADLRAPLEKYFTEVLHQLELALKEARSRGELARSVNVQRTARAIAASVQGGYVLSRALGDAAAVNDATAGALALLEQAKPAKH